MRTINDTITSVMEVIGEITEYDLVVSTSFRNALLDSPISKITVAVGVERAVFNSSSVSAYSGERGNEDFYAVHGDLDLSTNIYLPSAVSGQTLLEVLSHIILALEKSPLPVCRVESGTLRYDNTLMCSVLPVTVTLSDYLFKEEDA